MLAPVFNPITHKWTLAERKRVRLYTRRNKRAPKHVARVLAPLRSTPKKEVVLVKLPFLKRVFNYFAKRG